VFALMARLFYPRATRILAVSEGIRRSLIQRFGFPAEQTAVVNNSIDLEYVAQAKIEYIDHPWFSDPSIRVILGVGRLIDLKHWSDLIEALRVVRKDIDARLIILGEGPLRSVLEDQVANLGLSDMVDLAGYKINPYPWMASSDVFALTSVSEGFPNVILEAMACGLPVVSTDCHAGPAEILNESSYGILVPNEDIQAMARAIRKILLESDLAQTQREKGCQRVKYYSVDRIADRFLAELDKIG
jgi:glycosyltransferase involved in cell wall biosynthesis